MENIGEIIKEIRNCGKCNLESVPLVFEPKDRESSIIVISEAPGRLLSGPSDEPQEQIWLPFWKRLRSTEKEKLWKKGILSFTNPIYRYLQGVFNGKFDPTTTTYWTHYAKCFHKPLRSTCSESFLLREIIAIKPKLIIAIGSRSGNFMSKFTPQISSKLTYETRLLTVTEMQRFPTVELPTLAKKPKLVLLPHPSRANRATWNRIGKTVMSVMIPRLRKEIKGILRH